MCMQDVVHFVDKKIELIFKKIKIIGMETLITSIYASMKGE